MALAVDINRLLAKAERADKDQIRKTWTRIKGSGISWDLWQAAFAAHDQHVLNTKLQNHTIFTLVDFRLPSSTPRLWIVRLQNWTVFGPIYVSHGRGSVGEGGKAEYFLPRLGMNMSMVGAFATFPYAITTPAGQTEADKSRGKTDTALQVYGLDPGLNTTAKDRQVIFHGAWYVSRTRAGNSKGCFATTWQNNRTIIPIIKGGTFVFSYAGSKVEKELRDEYKKKQKEDAARRAHEAWWRSLDI